MYLLKLSNTLKKFIKWLTSARYFVKQNEKKDAMTEGEKDPLSFLKFLNSEPVRGYTVSEAAEHWS